MIGFINISVFHMTYGKCSKHHFNSWLKKISQINCWWLRIIDLKKSPCWILNQFLYGVSEWDHFSSVVAISSLKSANSIFSSFVYSVGRNCYWFFLSLSLSSTSFQFPHAPQKLDHLILVRSRQSRTMHWKCMMYVIYFYCLLSIYRPGTP